MATITLGNIGEQITLQLRQGADFGPIAATMQTPEGTLVNLTGCTLRGQIKKSPQDSLPLIVFSTAILDALAGSYSFWLPHTETARLSAGNTPTDAASTYVWDFEMEDSAGHIIPLYYGPVHVRVKR